MKQLDAINMILDELGTRHVSSPDSEHPDAKSAVLQLDIEARSLLERGWWFNTLTDVDVPVQANGYIVLPTNVLVAIMTDPADRVLLVQRGQYIWNSKTNSRSFTQGVNCVQYINLEWGELPHNAQLAVVHAATAAVVRAKLYDEVKANSSLQKAAAFESLLSETEMRTHRPNAFENDSVVAMRRKLRRRS